MDLTRRGLIARGAAAAGALMSGSLLAPRLVFAGSAGEAVWQLRLPRTRIVESRRTFELIAIDLPSGADAEVRGRGLDGRWSEWLPLHRGEEHGPDAHGASGAADAHGAASSATFSDPVWLGPSRAFELRSHRPLHGRRVVFVDSGRPATASAAKRYVDAGLPAGAGQPPIIARSSWATSACRPRVPAVFGGVQLAFVHHTVSSNSYRPSQSAAMVRSICLFHKYGNGWNDIGYNFVVDRYGQVFEGRQGGIDEAIVGAQAGGYNTFSTGVALLGTFASSGPPRKMFASLARLLAWKLSLHGLPVTGKTTVQVSRQGAPYSRYRAGTKLRLNRISGHRDADTTECPGGAMYRQLPRLRQAVARLTHTPSRLAGQVQSAAPGNVALGGLLTVGTAPIPGAIVELQRHSTTAAPVPLATATTNADGSWSVSLALTTNTQLRAIYRGDPAHGAAVSNALFAAVPAQINLGADTSLVPPGGTVVFSGNVAPPKKKLTLVVTQQQPDGSFKVVHNVKLVPAADGSFSQPVAFPAPGQYQVTAQSAADAANVASSSAPVAITVA